MFKPTFPGHRETCCFCDATWGSCGCDFGPADDEDRPGFMWEDFWIIQPNLSVCTRFFVDPEVYYGQAYVAAKHLVKPASR